MSRIALCLGLAAALFFSCPWRAGGEERGGAGEWEEKTRQEDNGGEEELSALEGMELDFSSVEELLGSRKQGEGRFSFEELLKAVFRGDMKEACSMAFHGISDSLFSELSAGAGQMAKILLIALTGAVFTCFSDIFSGGQISETAFYVTFLLLFSLLASSFYESIAVADQAVSQAFELMKALTPGYFMTVAFTGGSLSAGASCGWMLFSITAAQWLLSHLIFPVFRVYILLVLAGHLTKEGVFSRMTEGIRTAVEWSMKTLTGAVLGFHLLQGMVLPYADAVKNASLKRMVSMIPGLGQGALTVSQMVLGSGILIKNTVGAGAALALLAVTAVPMIKLFVLMLMYHLMAAAAEPICDKQLTACMADVGKGHQILLKLVFTSLLLLVVSIGVICMASNASYYAA